MLATYRTLKSLVIRRYSSDDDGEAHEDELGHRRPPRARERARRAPWLARTPEIMPAAATTSAARSAARTELGNHGRAASHLRDRRPADGRPRAFMAEAPARAVLGVAASRAFASRSRS